MVLQEMVAGTAKLVRDGVIITAIATCGAKSLWMLRNSICLNNYPMAMSVTSLLGGQLRILRFTL
jgi:hypothetical protein